MSARNAASFHPGCAERAQNRATTPSDCCRQISQRSAARRPLRFTAASGAGDYTAQPRARIRRTVTNWTTSAQGHHKGNLHSRRTVDLYRNDVFMLSTSSPGPESDSSRTAVISTNWRDISGARGFWHHLIAPLDQTAQLDRGSGSTAKQTPSTHSSQGRAVWRTLLLPHWFRHSAVPRQLGIINHGNSTSELVIQLLRTSRTYTLGNNPCLNPSSLDQTSTLIIHLQIGVRPTPLLPKALPSPLPTSL